MDLTTQRAIKKFPQRAADIAQSFDEKQIKSKKWLVEELFEVFYNHGPKTIAKIKRINILASWYGQIISELITSQPIIKQELLALQKFKELPAEDLFIKKSNLHFYEIDRKAIQISKLYNPTSNFTEKDITKMKFSGSDKLVINTSCEHMKPINIKKCMVAFQSNNYFEVEDHINCVNSVEELIEQYNFDKIYYKGELEFPKYKRFMVIGKLN